MFAMVLDFALFLFVTFFLVPGLVLFAHVMRNSVRGAKTVRDSDAPRRSR